MIAIISDIHSNLEALKAVLKEIKRMKIKSIYCAGDVIGYGSDPNPCCEIVRKKRIPCVLGNHEYGFLSKDLSWFNPWATAAMQWTIKNLKKENEKFLKTLPKKIELKIEGRRIVVFHGSPNDVFEYIYPDTPDHILLDFLEETHANVLILGHTHIPFIKKVEGRLVINPGAVGQPRDGNPKASFALLDLKKTRVRIIRIGYDVDKVAGKIIKAGLPNFLAERLYKGL